MVEVISIKSVNSNEYKNQLKENARNDPIKNGGDMFSPSVILMRVAAKAKIRLMNATVK